MAKQFIITGKKEPEKNRGKVKEQGEQFTITGQKESEGNQEKMTERAERFINEGEKYGTIALPPSMWKALKMKATAEDTTIKRLVKDGVEWRLKH